MGDDLVRDWSIALQVATSALRATVLTSSGKLSTFVDDLLIHPPAFARECEAATAKGLPRYSGTRLLYK